MMKGSDDLSELTKTIRNIIEEGVKKTKSMPSPCIFRVPEKLRKVKESAYTPQLVSIGPLHSNKEHLKSPMEDIKKHYAAILFSRVDKKMPFPLVLQKCVEKMKELLHTARGCYAEKVEVDAPEDVEKMKESLDKAKECKWFAEKVDAKDAEKMKESSDRAKECFAEKLDDRYVTMLIIDGCFILELLYRYHHTYNPNFKTSSNPNFKPNEEPHHTDKIGTSNNANSNNKPSRDFCFDSALTRVAIKHDLLLLENQLPLIVLKGLFDLTVATIPNHLPSLGDYLVSYFGNMMNPSEQGRNNDWETKIEGVSHILHFLYNQYREGRPEQQDSPKTYFNNYDSMPPASELEYAGVKFEASTKTGDRGFMVQFDSPQGLFWCCHRASFKIPTLRISAATETLLRNLIAFEQYYTGLDNNTGPGRLDFYFTSCAILMDRLINTDKDVKVLEKAGVVRNCLGDREQASDMFNSLCKEIVLPRDIYFARTCNQAASYSKRRWPKSLAYLRRTYFAYPWTFIAFLVAFIAFGMSVTQFIRSFLR